MTISKPITERRRKKKKRGCTAPLLLFLFVLCLALAAVGGYGAVRIPAQTAALFGPPSPNLERSRVLYYSVLLLSKQEALLTPMNPNGSEVNFNIEQGESTQALIEQLYLAGLIPDTSTFSTYLSYSGLDTTIQAGRYSLTPAMTPVEIAHALQDATPKDVDFNIIAGWRVEEIAAALPTSGLTISEDEFLQTVAVVPISWTLSSDIPPGMGLEGFLMPGSYTIPREASIDQLISTILDAFSAQVTPELKDGFEKQGLSLYEAVTLASIVQREAVLEDEMPVIASVFYNRLDAGMPLASDPTVQYTLGYNSNTGTWWTNPLSLEDLQVDSPYNTYIYPGLPPGPIANPGIQSLQAVALPADTPYYYFRSACDGSGRHLFSETFDEHLQNECP